LMGADARVQAHIADQQSSIDNHQFWMAFARADTGLPVTPLSLFSDRTLISTDDRRLERGWIGVCGA
jgi:hypothetical protein